MLRKKGKGLTLIVTINTTRHKGKVGSVKRRESQQRIRLFEMVERRQAHIETHVAT